MNKYTVLCVDDEENVLNSLRRLLRRENYRVLTAANGYDALNLIRSETVHLILSDQRMPSMNGTDLLAAVCAESPHTVRMVLSGYADVATIIESINQGHIFRFLGKPWNDDDLKANLRIGLEQYELLASHRQLTEELARKNRELEQLTANLEDLVEERTACLQMAQDALEHLSLPVMGISTDGMVAVLNQACRNLLGKSCRPAVGMAAIDVLPDDVGEAWRRRTKEGQAEELEIESQIKGTLCRVRFVDLRRWSGEVRGVLVSWEMLPCAMSP